MLRSTKIVATLGPASGDPAVLEKMIRAGVDVARLNFSHGSADDHRKRAELVREIARKAGRTVAIMCDLQGPKIRIGKFRDGKAALQPGSRFILDANCKLGDDERVGLDYKELPRDVEPAVGEVGNVFLYDIDDLTQIVDENLERRKSELPEAERMVAASVDDFWAWYTSLEVVPLIRALRGHAESLRQMELEKAFRRMQHLSDDDRQAIEVLTKQLLNKVLHEPTVRLREAAGNGKGPGVVEAARYLFQLDPPGSRETKSE